MIRASLRRIAFAIVATPLALSAAACGDDAGKGGASGEPVAKVAAPAGKAWADVIQKTPEGGYRMGNPNAPIKVIEFASLTCPHCAEFAEASGPELREKFVGSGRVSFEFRNFVRDAIDITAAQLTRCGTPESFFPLTDQVLANQEAIFAQVQKAGEAAFNNAMKLPDAQRGPTLGQITGLTEFFSTRGISRDQANACLANPAEAQAIAKRQQADTEQYAITGTPTLVVNGEKLAATSWPELKAELERLGAR